MIKSKMLVGLLALGLAFIQTEAPTPYQIDTAHSNIGFSVPILGGLSKVRGKFTDFSVNLVHDEKDITKSSVTATIKAASIDTGIEKRDAHLRTADFFDVEKFPEITFKSKRVEGKGNQLVAVGDLTMHGVTKEVTMPIAITGRHRNPENNRVNIGYLAKLTLNRRDYGINWRNANNPDFVGDEVEIEISLITRPVEVK